MGARPAIAPVRLEMGARACMALASAGAVLASLLPPGAAQVTQNIVAMEEYMVAAINRGRDHPVSGQNPNGETFGLAFHGCITNDGPSCQPLSNPDGLRRVAREHTAAQAASGTLNPFVTQAQIATASPDPPEPNGPPDDGFSPAPYTYCVNVARTTPIPNGVFVERSAVDKTYDAWRDPANRDPLIDELVGSGQRECMFDESHVGYTAAAAGWVKEFPDAGHYRLWVTLIVIKDRTPNFNHVIYPCEPPYCPGPTPTPTATPTPPPTPTPSPTPTPTPFPTPSPTPTIPPSPTPIPCFPPRETAIAVAGFYLVTTGGVELWRESNGAPGLQRRSWTCPDGTVVPSDTRAL